MLGEKVRFLERWEAHGRMVFKEARKGRGGAARGTDDEQESLERSGIRRSKLQVVRCHVHDRILHSRHIGSIAGNRPQSGKTRSQRFRSNGRKGRQRASGLKTVHYPGPGLVELRGIEPLTSAVR